MRLGWQDELQNNVTSIEELKKYIDIPPAEEEKLRRVVDIHPMSIPRYYLSLIDRSDPDDPIRKIAVPSVHELDVDGSYDTSGERDNTKLTGLQHKYARTVLLLLSNICSMYCRHCFRKRMVGVSGEETMQRLDEAAAYITDHPEINNILISGGDSLALPTRVVEHCLEKLVDIEHLDFIRFGSRMPVSFPDRILLDPGLPELFRRYSSKNKRIYLITHFNHPAEVTAKAVEAVDRFIRAGIIVNNQTVLLHEVNDAPEILARLLNRLVSIGVNPYYVFQCRPVKRVKSHFQVPLARGYAVVEEAKRRLNGHSKRFRYIMAHPTGKIEIVGILDDEIYFKYHQAKAAVDMGRLFKKKLDDTAGWLDDLEDCVEDGPEMPCC